MKQVIVVRSDLKMGIGKIAAQSCHASLEAYKKTNIFKKKLWELENQKKVVLKTDSPEELKRLFAECKKQKLPCSIIRDAGRTQLKPGTCTAIGIGPDSDENIDRITGHLKLY